MVMNRSKTMLFAAALFVGVAPSLVAQSLKISPASMPKTGTIDERFQSYNIETVEITGGRFWKPYAPTAAATPVPNAAATPGMDPSLYEYRPPLDLSNARLRKLAAALGPAYVRISGTWMNATYFQNTDAPAPPKPPAGFNSVLTRQEWKGVVDFARAANAKIVTSFAISPGTRDASGLWMPAQAEALAAYTVEGAYSEFAEHRKGALKPGYMADLVVLSADIEATAPEALHKIRPVTTICGGKITYQA